MLRFLLCVALAVFPALAWNHVGHKAVAGMAYDRLSGRARAKVDSLIHNHPDYQLWLTDAPLDKKGRARHAFMQSAYWPDTIRSDPRFYDESRSDQQPTPAPTGYADMRRHTNWHYINMAFSPDGTPFPPPPPVNVLSQIKLILGVIGTEPPPAPGSVNGEMDPTYLLPWLLHLVGDVHNPMHCTSRWKRDQVDPKTGRPWSDLGGNGVFVVGAFNLHAYWDNALGITDTPVFINGVIKFLKGKGQEGEAVLDPQEWVNEGAKLAEAVCYNLGSKGTGTKEDPITLPDVYGLKAREVARERAALGARRLAAVLNERFK